MTNHVYRLGLAIAVVVVFAAMQMFFDPSELSKDVLAVYNSTIESVIKLMIAMEVAIIGWLAYSLKRKALKVRLLDLVTLVILTSADVLAFAAYFRANLLSIGNALQYPNTSEALYFSVMAFTGNVQAPFAATAITVHMVTLEALVGFFFTPILISLIFILLED